MSWAEDNGIDIGDSSMFYDVGSGVFSQNRRQAMATVAKNIWVMKEGKFIPIKDMTDSHLLNTIRLLRKNASKGRWDQIRSIDSYPGGDPSEGYYDCAGMEVARLEEMTDEEFLTENCRQWTCLLREAKKRKLDEGK